MMRTPACLLVALLISVPASASPFTWLVQGQVTNVQDIGSPHPFDGAFTVGQPYAWWITMESSAPDFEPRAGCAQYTPITSMRFESGALALAIESPAQDYFVNAGGAFCIPPFANAARLRSDFGTGLYFSMHYYARFASDALPVTVDMLAPGTLDFLLFSPNGRAIANASVTSITTIAAIPEPIAAALILGGIAAVLRSRRRRYTR